MMTLKLYYNPKAMSLADYQTLLNESGWSHAGGGSDGAGTYAAVRTDGRNAKVDPKLLSRFCIQNTHTI